MADKSRYRELVRVEQECIRFGRMSSRVVENILVELNIAKFSEHYLALFLTKRLWQIIALSDQRTRKIQYLVECFVLQKQVSFNYLQACQLLM